MIVLSLFDGISIARQALEYSGIPVEKYYASEIDKYALAISKHNWLDNIQLGDITKIENIPDKIDLLIGGSPCTDLSQAKSNRQGLEGKHSSLFWEYVRLKTKLKPKYFIFENVESMPIKDGQIISQALGCQAVMIDAALVSAQKRKRFFWTNISGDGLLGEIVPPIDKGILLKDILENGETINRKSYCIDANYFKGASLEQYLKKSRRQLIFNGGSPGNRVYTTEGKSVTLSANGGGLGAKTGLYLTPCALTETRTDEAKQIRRENMLKGKDWSPRRGKELVPRDDGKMNCLTTGTTKEHNLFDGMTIRKLTPIECERLQSLPDNYTKYGIDEKGNKIEISNTQRYKCIGNGFNSAVIQHILKNITEEK